MWRIFWIGMLLLSLVAGYPYATLVLCRLAGTNTVVLTEHDGTQRALISGPSAPLPGWLPELPGAITLSAVYWLPTPDRPLSGGLELLTHKSVAGVKQFYLDALKAKGFDIRDIGFGMLNIRTAAFFGIDGELHGYRADDHLEIHVTITEATGQLVRPRTVKLQWARSDVDATLDREKPFVPWNIRQQPGAAYERDGRGG